MSAGAYAALLGTELRMLLRDRRTVLASLILPAAVLPLMMAASSRVGEIRESRYRTVDAGILVEPGLPPGAQEILDGAVRSAGLHPEGEGAAVTVSWRDRGGRAPGVLVVSYSESDDVSERAAAALHGSLEAALDSAGIARMDSLGAGRLPFGLLIADLADPSDSAGASAGRFALLLCMTLLVSGVSVAALDSIAGERERGTLESLLSSPAGRRTTAAAKLSAACIVGLASVSVQLADLALMTRLDLIPVEGLPEMDATRVLHASALLFSGALLAASAVMAASATARTYREAQSRVLPVFVLLVPPALVTLFPAVRMSLTTAALPVAGAALALREALAGRADVLMTAVSAASMVAAAGLLGWRTAAVMGSEEILSDQAPRTGPGLFSRKAPVYFATVWVATALLTFQAGSLSGPRTALLAGQGLLAGSALFAILRWRLPREMTRMRLPDPLQALLCLPAAAGALVLSAWSFRAASLVLPVSARVAEAVAGGLREAGGGLAGTIGLMCVLPAVSEELLFRGVLLGSLERRHGVLRALLATSLAFGAFHLHYFRMLPTAVTGLAAGLAAVRTRSVASAMLLHACVNGAALLMADRIGALPFWTAPAALALAAGSIMLMGRPGSGPRPPGRRRSSRRACPS